MLHHPGYWVQLITGWNVITTLELKQARSNKCRLLMNNNLLKKHTNIKVQQYIIMIFCQTNKLDYTIDS